MNKNGDVITKNRLDGDDLRALFSCVTRLFESNVKSINDLNVFPVPDGDTGTNMVMTLRDALKSAQNVSSNSASDVAKAIYQGAFKGARGNSGVILAEFLRGLAIGFEGLQEVGVPELANALNRSKEYAYNAVGEPREGTILTVIDRTAKTAQLCAESDDSLAQTAEAISEAAWQAVALTPTMLAVLRNAGVVDAGGQGLAVILEGFKIFTRGESAFDYEIAPPDISEVENVSGGISLEFLDSTEDEVYGYCTQFMITAENIDIDEVRENISLLGKSSVVTGDNTIMNVHLHAEDPGAVISYGLTLGSISRVKIENMDEQRAKFVDTHRSALRKNHAQLEAGDISVIAVASGDGFEQIFLNELGVTSVLTGGDTMNPSVGQIIDIVERAPSNDVIFLPNNKNIVMAAKQASEQTGKNLRIVDSKTIPQGIAAMLEFNPERGIEENLADMEGAISNVRTGEVVKAIREVNVNGVSVSEGQIIGLVEHEIVTAGDSPGTVLVSLLRHAEVSEGELVTMYWGGDLSEQDAVSIYDKVADIFTDAEIELVSGGQPYYHFIVSIE